jgi:hypothetical protein
MAFFPENVLKDLLTAIINKSILAQSYFYSLLKNNPLPGHGGACLQCSEG